MRDSWAEEPLDSQPSLAVEEPVTDWAVVQREPLLPEEVVFESVATLAVEQSMTTSKEPPSTYSSIVFGSTRIDSYGFVTVDWMAVVVVAGAGAGAAD